MGADKRDGRMQLLAAGAPPYAAYIEDGSRHILSLSPELFLRREGSTVTSRPVKGTRARPALEQDAAADRAWLERSAKNRSENVMITDLMRSDLSRVCTPGSVAVPRLAAAEAHPGLWHLVSEVTGQLTDGESGPTAHVNFANGTSVTAAVVVAP